MNIKKSITVLISFSLIRGIAFAQSPNSNETLLCNTSDGTLTITPASIQIRDYFFTLTKVDPNEVAYLEDVATHTTATLDARDEEGIYFTITEENVRMQLVAPRESMRIVPANENGSEPGYPISQYGLFKLLYSSSIARAEN